MISLDQKFYLVNEEGEIINEISTKDGDRIIVDRKEVRDNKLKTQSYLAETEKLNYPFIKLNMKEIEKVADISLDIFKLLPYTGYLDNVLKFNNGILLNMTHVEKIIGNSREYVRRSVANMVENDLLRKHGRGKSAYFVINPWICHKGKRISKLTLEEFENSKWRGADNSDDSI